MSKKLERPISVWMVQHVFFPLWAGPAERFLRYFPGLKSRGAELSFVTAFRKGLLKREIIDGADVYRIGSAQKNVSSYQRFTIRALLFALLKRPNVVLLFGLTPVHIPFLWLVRISGIKVIFINTMSRTRQKEEISIKTRLSDFFHLIILNSVDKLVFSSDALAGYLDSIGFKDKRKVEIIPNGVDIGRFRVVSESEKKNLRKKLSLPENQLIFLYVGLRVPRKGVMELLKSWRAYKQENGKGCLVLVGREQNEKPALKNFYIEWNNLVQDLNPEEQVIIKPPSKKIDEYFKASDTFVFLSKHEGMPNVILEAMGCGLPVLTTKFEGFSKAFGRDKYELIITSHDIEQIKSDLHSLSDRTLVEKLGINARNWIEKNQNLELILDKYADLFLSV